MLGLRHPRATFSKDPLLDETSTHQVTRLLKAWSDGDRAVLDQLAPLVEAELRRLAKHYMRRERADHTLQATALVNEAFVRLIDWKNADWKNRAQFSAAVSKTWGVNFLRPCSCACSTVSICVAIPT